MSEPESEHAVEQYIRIISRRVIKFQSNQCVRFIRLRRLHDRSRSEPACASEIWGACASVDLNLTPS